MVIATSCKKTAKTFGKHCINDYKFSWLRAVQYFEDKQLQEVNIYTLMGKKLFHIEILLVPRPILL